MAYPIVMTRLGFNHTGEVMNNVPRFLICDKII